MSRKCEISGVKPLKGRVIHRRGLAKKKGGVGQHVTATNVRTFDINLKKRRIWVPELNKFVTVKLTMRALKTINKNGAYKTLKAAGLIKAAPVAQTGAPAAKG
jgi:large subunit ribosomal protein L28